MVTCVRAWQWLKKAKQSRTMVLIVVYIALLLDYILLTVVVPIIPSFLNDKHFVESSTSPRPPQAFSSTASTEIPPSSYGPLLTVNRTEGFEWRNTTEAPIPGLRPTTGSVNCSLSEALFVEENLQIGFLFASKAIVQLIVNPMVGPLTNRVGYHTPMFFGFVILFVSTMMYAFANTYILLFVARALQGIGSSCSSVAGLAMLASHYPDDIERGKAMGIALGGAAVGVLVGAPFGSVMYEFVGKSAPFLTLAALALFDGVLQLCIFHPTKVIGESQKGESLLTLLRDPYILIAAGSLCFANMAIAILEQALPLWMLKTMCTPHLYLGLIFLPGACSYLIATNLFGILANKMGRWLCALIGMLILGVSMISVPQATNIFLLITPFFGVGISIGMIDSSLVPAMGYLVDIRHVSVYGSIYALTDVALCLGFAIGPSIGGAIVKLIGFPWLMFIIGIINIVYAPFCVFLKNPPVKEEKMTILPLDNAMNQNSYTAERNVQEVPLTEARNKEATKKK